MTGADQVDVAALRALLMDMLTPDPTTTLVGAVQYTLPMADRLAAILAPHLSPADKVEVSRRMAALQAMTRDGNTCG